MIRYFAGVGRPNEVDATYRKQIAFEPGNAWTYGSYAQFLLCSCDEYDDAISRSRQALKRMNYGMV